MIVRMVESLYIIYHNLTPSLGNKHFNQETKFTMKIVTHDGLA